MKMKMRKYNKHIKIRGVNLIFAGENTFSTEDKKAPSTLYTRLCLLKCFVYISYISEYYDYDMGKF